MAGGWNASQEMVSGVSPVSSEALAAPRDCPLPTHLSAHNLTSGTFLVTSSQAWGQILKSFMSKGGEKYIN